MPKLHIVKETEDKIVVKCAKCRKLFEGTKTIVKDEDGIELIDYDCEVSSGHSWSIIKDNSSGVKKGDGIYDIPDGFYVIGKIMVYIRNDINPYIYMNTGEVLYSQRAKYGNVCVCRECHKNNLSKMEMLNKIKKGENR